MKVTKKVISHLEKNYALCDLHYQGQDCFLLASELEKDCLLFDRDGKLLDTVWKKPGGVMSMVQVPGTDGQFLVTTKFYGFNNAAAAVISIVTPLAKGSWEVRTLCELPFVHRIDIIERNGVKWLIACQLKSGHEYDNDWRFPGKVFAAVLPDDLSGYNENNQLPLTLVREGMPRNHGYYRTVQNGVTGGIICSDAGIDLFLPPENAEGEWTVEKLTADPASDAVLADFDGDGEEELGVIAPFHGEKVRIYKKKNGAFEKIWEYGSDLPFCHAFYGGPLCGKTVLLVGHRSGDRDLLVFSYDAEKADYTVEKLDEGRGPANVLYYQHNGRDVIVATNRETDEAAIYELEP